VVERHERPAAGHGGQAGAGERLAQLASERHPEERIGISPQDPDRAGELAEPAGGVEQDARTEPSRERGEVAADRLAVQVAALYVAEAADRPQARAEMIGVLDRIIGAVLA
jgi:hypothetical protein